MAAPSEHGQGQDHEGHGAGGAAQGEAAVGPREGLEGGAERCRVVVGVGADGEDGADHDEDDEERPEPPRTTPRHTKPARGRRR